MNQAYTTCPHCQRKMDKRCGNCAHYQQHYVRTEDRGYTTTYAGHCVHPRIKDRKPNDPACAKWEPKMISMPVLNMKVN